jgi:hypothetical protein
MAGFRDSGQPAMKRAAASLVVSFLVGMLVLPVGWAQDLGEPATRSVVISQAGEGFLLTSDRNATLAQDSMSLAGFLRRASYDASLSVARPDGPAAETVRITIRSLVEFQDNDGDGGYSLGDPVVQQILMSDAWWTEWQRTGTAAAPTGPGAPGVVVRYHLPANAAFLDVAWNATQDPATGLAQLGFGVQVTGFPFDSDDATNLALELRVTGDLEASSASLRTTGDPHGIDLDWGRQNATLEAYTTGAEDEWVLLLVAPRSPDIAFQIGVDATYHPRPPDAVGRFQETIRGDWGSYAVGLVLATLLVGLPFLVRRATQRRPPEGTLDDDRANGENGGT